MTDATCDYHWHHDLAKENAELQQQLALAVKVIEAAKNNIHRYAHSAELQAALAAFDSATERESDAQ